MYKPSSSAVRQVNRLHAAGRASIIQPAVDSLMSRADSGGEYSFLHWLQAGVQVLGDCSIGPIPCCSWIEACQQPCSTAE